MNLYGYRLVYCDTTPTKYSTFTLTFKIKIMLALTFFIMSLNFFTEDDLAQIRIIPKERTQNRATLAIFLARQNYKLASRGELALFFSELTMLRKKRVISIRKNLSQGSGQKKRARRGSTLTSGGEAIRDSTHLMNLGERIFRGKI